MPSSIRVTAEYILGAAVPTEGSWRMGDVCINSAPTAITPTFWLCTATGSPGTWAPVGSGSLAMTVLSAAALTGTLLSIDGIEDTITAHAGGTQAAALALSGTKSIHNITVVGTAADSVKLPLATGSGQTHWVKNSAAANSLQLFGSGTDTIDAVVTATGVAVAAGKSRLLVDIASGKYVSLLGA